MTEDLSPEDSFRLQVLLAQDLKAVRIDESNLVLHALTSQGEASIPLAPNCRADRYLRLVREILSGHALGSPGGYPVYLSRWTRQGQVEGENLGRLLLTGEPEAVAAVVYSPALTDELAANAWWTEPTIENARLMLRREAVARGRMGPVLAGFLADHLPFLQDDHLSIMDSVAVLIRSRALSQEHLEGVWRKGRRVNSHYVAFLELACHGHDLPTPLPPHPDLETSTAALAGRDQEPGVAALLRALSAQGQTFLAAAADVLERPETQEATSRTLNAIGQYFGQRRGPPGTLTAPLSDACQAYAPRLEAASRLALCDDMGLKPIFARSTAIGSLMRRKIEPVIRPILADLSVLRA